MKAGIEKAQRVVDILKSGLNKNHGSGLIPHFSRKVNHLLSYTNGDALYREIAETKKASKFWFDRSGVHFNKKLVEQYNLSKRNLSI